MKKRLIIGALAMAILIGGISFIYTISTSKDRYEGEISLLREYINNHDAENIEKSLNRTVSFGDYGQVEKAVKDFYRNQILLTETSSKVMDNNLVIEAIDAASLKENASKDFSENFTALAESKQQLNEAFKVYEHTYSDQAYKEFLGENPSEELLQAYKDATSEDFDSEIEQKGIKSSYDMLFSTIDAYEKELNLLKDNKSKWSISHNKIVFTSNSLKKKYNQILIDAMKSAS